LAQASKTAETDQTLAAHIHKRLREGAMLVLVFIAIYLAVSLFSYSPDDPGWSYTGTRDEVVNSGGPAGAWFADVFLNLFGYLAYLLPLMVAWAGWLVIRERDEEQPSGTGTAVLRWAGFLAILVAGSTLASIHVTASEMLMPAGSGGILGRFLMEYFVSIFHPVGGTLLLLAVFLSGITLFTGLSWFTVMDMTGGAVLALLRMLNHARLEWQERRIAQHARQERSEIVKQEQKKQEKRKPPKIEPVVKKVKQSEREEKERQAPLFKDETEGELPPLALLDPVSENGNNYTKEALEAMSRLVELKLQDFRIESEVVAVHPGPVVTLYELQLAPGTKASRITNLAKDLARALSTISVRVVEVIPGKSVIGLEIPNEHREIVYLSEVLKSEAYEKSKATLTLALGKDIAGEPVVANLAKMPHILIAGTTGAGKSVAINAMVLSLLYKYTPDEVRLIMVDPKMLELSVYDDIPHLLTPVVTDMKEASNALRWCVLEMERRYRLMASLGVRNIGGYNNKVKEAESRGEPLANPLYDPDSTNPLEQMEHLESLPYIVVIVDELADMMMVVGKKVEELIARLAQKARASGVHLMLATQRPSVDVITGLIKANIPTRIAFQVSSRVDSRTILDQMGAEQLLGHGDMLYLPPGTAVPQRIHGAYVDDEEVHRVVTHLRESGKPDYIEDIVCETSESIPGMASESQDVEDSDPLYDEAVHIVTQTRRASISGVQRRLKIGYNRAARMIEEMERTGIVGPQESNGNRQVLAPPPPE
jgi:S-DNA-T family DNA segregation ATPase FtsK/SpoIIIE